MRAARLLLIVFAALLTLWSLAAVLGGGEYLLYLVGRGDIVDGWALLSLLEVLAAIIGVLGAWLAIRRRAHRWAVLFLALQLPAPMVIEANRCDLLPCRLAWAQLPRSFFEWRLRIRPVRNAGDAQAIAYGALRRAGLTETPGLATPEAGLWIVPTWLPSDQPGSHVVVIEARTGKATVVERQVAYINQAR